MSALSIQPTFPIFTGTDGLPLENGYIWIGAANLDPQGNPITVYWDAALTIAAPQPIRTINGYPSRSGTPARVYVNSNYSIRVQDKNASTVYSAPQATERYGNIINANGVVYDPPFTGAVQTNVEAKLAQIVSVKDFGAVGDGVTDDTAAIQAAFDSTGLAPVYFPPGTYKVTGTGIACLTLAKNKMLFGCGRASVIRADAASASTSLLLIAITDNGGFTDVRNWSMRDIHMFHNGGGFNGLIFAGGFSISNSQIDNCQFYAGAAPSSYGLYVFDQLSHSKITNCTFDTAYMKCFDANVFDKCTTFGKSNAILFDCELGVRNNSVLNCTIVNRDGQVYIANGDNIRIENNQFEVAQGFTPPENQSPVSSMVVLAGIDRPVINTVIRANNFGGGTSVDRLIYVGNAQRSVITQNQFIAANVSEIELTANAKYNVVAFDNTTIGSISDPRPGALFKFLASDAGVGNMGVLQTGNSVLNPQNSWNAPDFYKDANGIVTFIGTFEAGVPASGTVLGTLPVGFRPTTTSSFGCTTSSGLGFVNINAVTGVITAGSLPSNSGVLVNSFQSATTQE